MRQGRLSSYESAELRYQHRASHEWSSELGELQNLELKSTLTCSGMPVAMRWRTLGTTLARCRPTLATQIFRTRRATLR